MTADTLQGTTTRAARPTLVWFRRDLRLDDHPALSAAAATGGPVVPVFVWAPEEDGDWPLGAAGRTWLLVSLRRLDDQLGARGSHLVVRGGPSDRSLLEIALEVGASAVAWNRALEPAALDRDSRVVRRMRKAGLAVHLCEPNLLHDPALLRTRAGDGFKVFTPFYRVLRSQPLPSPAPSPARLPAPLSWPASDRRWQTHACTATAVTASPSTCAPAPTSALSPWIALPGDSSPPSAGEPWEPGLLGAERRAAHFLDVGLADYPRDRDFPGVDGTSRLSPHLAAGEIGPRRLWWLADDTGHDAAPGAVAAGAETFQRQLAWREFGYHLLAHAPMTTGAPLRSEFARFPWEDDPSAEAAWRTGRTGYPFVDAGIRQLLGSGWIHNRVRMVVASFLVKDLLVPWQHGARFFWERLVDADLANNTLGWQWVAGSGADAAPFFRIFNPVLQGRRYDPAGAYVRRWVPEVAGLPDRFVHDPWRAPDDVLARAGVRLGETYPGPLVDHGQARRRALAAFAQMRRV